MKIKWVAHVAKENAYTALAGKSEVKRLLGWQRLCLENNIKIDLKVIVWEGVDGIGQAEDRQKWRTALNMAMDIGTP
jgi:hypothetical protein